MHPHVEIPTIYIPDIRRGLEINGNTSKLLTDAKFDRIDYGLEDALGITTELDREGLEYFLARRRAGQTPMEATNLARVYSDLDKLIAAYTAEYPKESDRPYHISTGINRIFSDLEHYPVRGLWRRGARQRMAAYASGTTWRRLIQQSTP